MATEHHSRRIRILRENVSRRIAAGEVIDRPLSVVRELLDNSIDAQAKTIDLSIIDGGVGEIRVHDDGHGMSSADLALSVQPHATSKISTPEDLFRITTLGFRGEALSSIAACAKLEITSCEHGSSPGYRIAVHGGRLITSGDAASAPGTTVSVRDLFYTLPARRKFLDRTSTEAARCRRMFLEKALPFPRILFRYHADGELRATFPACESRLERVLSAHPDLFDRAILFSGSTQLDAVSAEAVVADPSFNRGDRRLVQIFVNNRRVDEYALVQAALHAYEPYLPGGRFPAAFVFLQIDPAEVDFNIHPAKREVRFHNPRTVHRAVVDAVADAAAGFAGRVAPLGRRVGRRPLGAPTDLTACELVDSAERRAAHRFEIDRYRDLSVRSKPSDDDIVADDGRFRYIGTLFSLFLVVEQNETLYLIDQHAAHERILYDAFRSSPGEVQRLLVPRRVVPAVDAAEETAALRERLARHGVSVDRRDDGAWYLTALPAGYRSVEHAIVEFIEEYGGTEAGFERSLFAWMACRAAVKDNDTLEDAAAIDLARQALALPEPRCPHGRPIWHRISRDDLNRFVGRT